MKTAMQELIDEMKEYNMILVKEAIEPSPLIQMLQHKAGKLLEKEKEQIADAFRNGSTSSMLGGGHWTQYYNQTYNQNK
jgi:hypothetical protein